MGIIIPAIIVSIGIVILIAIFYLGLFNRTFNLALLLFTIFTYIIVLVSFIYNSGLDGPILYFQAVSFLLLIAVSPKRSHLLILGLHILLSVGLIYIDYEYPQYILEVYDNANEKYIDHGVSIIVVLIITYVLIRNIRSHYARQNDLVKASAKELEEQKDLIKVQNETLESINTTQSRMISILSHDVRSPLNSIAGYLDLLATGVLTEEEQRSTSKQLLELTKQTDIMLVNLLSWSRSQIQGFSPKMEVISVADLLHEILIPIEKAAQQKKIKVEVDLENSDLISDREMLQLIIRNLMNNAVKYTHEQGTVSLKGWTNHSQYHIEVADTGTGIPESQQQTLFSQSTLSKAGTHNEKGTGLGLLLVKDFVEKLNGTISFTSVEGEGTTFSLAFPLQHTA